MRFRPCIDIHNGKVKQIVGGSLRDFGDYAEENFVSEQTAAFYAGLYRQEQLKGGHVILLNSPDSEYYESSKQQALAALRTYPGGLQIGGGIHSENAGEFLDAGASHVIVTSFVFQNGEIRYDNLEKMLCAVGKEYLVLDLSCRRKGNSYYIVTNRWQKFTEVAVTHELVQELSGFCSEFLVHAVDVEGKAQGIEKELVSLLAKSAELPITYAGGVGSLEDLQELKHLGKNRLDVTVGSALDLFGGSLPFKKVIEICGM